MKEIITYAQNREDIIIDAFFPDVKAGFYIDVGANDPVEDSVTKYFYDKGWNGINIEPIKSLYNKLEKGRKRDQNLNIGISSSSGKLTLREYDNHGISTFSSTSKKENDTDKYKDYEVEVQTLQWVFEKEKVKNVNFLKVDVEGYEYEVLEGNDWTKFRPELICIESNHIDRDWRPLLERNNYQKVFFDGLNDYYLAGEGEKRFELFKKSYPELLVSAPILKQGWSGKIEELATQLNKVQDALDSQLARNKQLEASNSQLEKELASLRTFKGATSHLARLSKNKVNSLKKRK